MVPFKGLFAIFLALALTNAANAGPTENVDEKGLSTESSRDKRKNDSGVANQYKQCCFFNIWSLTSGANLA